jgi:hypothetical protein
MVKINVFRSFVIMFTLYFGLSSSTFAECTKPVQPIEKGQAAPCSGFIFTEEAESKAFKATQLVDLYKEENEILERRLDLYIQQSDKLANEVATKRNNEDLYRGLYFALGVLATGIIAANVGH